MRLVLVVFLTVAGLLLVALVLPSKRDTSVAAWWTRVCYQLNFFVRVALALVIAGAIVWYVVMPLLGWRLPGG